MMAWELRGLILSYATHVAAFWIILPSIILQARERHRTMWCHTGGTTDSQATAHARPFSLLAHSLCLQYAVLE